MVREKIGHFIEVYCKCPLEVVSRRDAKGLYRKTLKGEILNFTGISDPYEAPVTPDVVLETDKEPPARCIEKLLEKLSKQDT